jgi:hypothetical protein
MTDSYVSLASDQAAAQERAAPCPVQQQALGKLDVKPMQVPKAR